MKNKHICRIQNQTPYRIAIRAQGPRVGHNHLRKEKLPLVLPPFCHKDISCAERDCQNVLNAYDFANWQDQGFIKIIIDPHQTLKEEENSWLVSLGYGVLVTLLWLFIAIPSSFLKEAIPESKILQGILSFFGLMVLTLVLFALTLFAARLLGRKETLRKLLRKTLLRIGVWFQKSPYVLLVLLIGWGIPALVLFNPQIRQLGLDHPDIWAILAIWAFIGIASTFPAMMYLLFGSQQLRKVHRSFIKTTLMLDPALTTLDEAEQKYGDLIEEVHGSSNLGNLNNLRGAATPFLISTLLITIGWTLTLFRENNFDIEKILKLPPEPIIFGFLGAYFFTINMVFRRYVQGDLTPKAYIHISFRIITTILIILTVNALYIDIINGPPNNELQNGGLLAVMAFLIGVVPETGTTILEDYYRKMRPSWGRKNKEDDLGLKEEYPLTDLDGISIYDRARFQEEGINNLINLVHHDLIDLVARIRLPTYRLIDLYDQAILYLHLSRDEGEIRDNLNCLRSYGIRTATDLIAAHQAFPEIAEILTNPPKTDDPGSEESENVSTSSNQISMLKMDVVCFSLNNQDWMDYLLKWRHIQGEPDEIQTLENMLNLSRLNFKTEEAQPIRLKPVQTQPRLRKRKLSLT